MNIHTDTAEFFAKAKELGLVDEIDSKLEARKHERRLAIIAKIKVLPTEDQTELPALVKASEAAHKTLQLAEEAYRAADRNYKELSIRLYGAQLKFDGARATLEREAWDLAPDFLREVWQDLDLLDVHVKNRARYDLELKRGIFSSEVVTTNNWDQVTACRQNIKKGRDRIAGMVLEPVEREIARAEALKLFDTLAQEAYALGVSRTEFADRYKPTDHVAREQDRAAKAGAKRAAQIASISV